MLTEHALRSSTAYGKRIYVAISNDGGKPFLGDTSSGAIQIPAKIAEDMSTLVIYGGTDMDVMAEIGQTRQGFR